MDPLVTLTAAATTKRLKVGTGVCLVIRRDTIQTAKLVASIDQVRGGRFLSGIGGGWNAEERGTRNRFYHPYAEDAQADCRHAGDLDQGHGRIQRSDR